MGGQRWAGVYTAITTKMDARQEVDLAGVRADVAFQIDAGVDGIICCGSIGEASTLTADEKMAIAHVTKEAARGKPVLLTVAEDSTRAAVALAERAKAAGMDGLMLLPAMRYVSDRRETIQHFRTVARATDLPIMVYNNPVAYSVDITPEMFAEMADETNFVAIKESSGDVRRITDILNTVGNRYDIFTGVDDLALESLMLGAVGWVAGLVCAFPRETVAIHKLVAAGRIPEALEIYRWFMPLLHLDVSLRFVQNVKLAEAIVRGTSTVVRQPRLELQGAERDRVETIVRTALAKRPDLAKYGV
ncbi:MAG TPA: dihydrodipicolinate synthase family protein [Inquilinus sp.]|nr:dihydrodipicolinate synthase family protein [Inquilinus sp.]